MKYYKFSDLHKEIEHTVYVSRYCDDVIAIWTLLARMLSVANIVVDLVAEAYKRLHLFFFCAHYSPLSLSHAFALL